MIYHAAMALDRILLGMLREPASGYDLKTAFSQSIGHFWDAELSQIYPTLTRLQKQGLLTVSRKPSDKGPPRKVYALTAAGRKALREWLRSPPKASAERLAWLAQLFFMPELRDRDEALAFLNQLRADFAAELAALEAIDARWRASDPTYPDVASDDDFYPQLTLALGLTKLRAKLEWCDESIARLKRRS